MEWAEFLRWLHIIGATVLLGTGSGIAFFMMMAHRSRDPIIIAHTAGVVVFADWLFTTTAVILQPITGTLLALETGWQLTEKWILWSLGLYVFVGCFWVPVIFIQMKLRDLACVARDGGTALPADYDKYFRIWFLCGIPAFIAVLVIIALMIVRPV